MRVLFLPIPGIAHAFAAVPLAWALRSAGHEVLVGTAGAGLAAGDAGLPVVDIAPGVDIRDLFRRTAQRHPELGDRMPSGRITDLRQAAAGFAVISGQLADAVVDLAVAWQPDLVVYSAMNGGALIAAAKLGVPAVDLGFGFGRAARLAPSMFAHMADVFTMHGADGLPEHRQSIDVAPPSMLAGSPEGWSMRFVPYNGGAVLPDWVLIRPQRPRIAVSMGTISPMGGLAAIGSLAAVAGQMDAEFVLAVGEVDEDAVGPLPANMRLAGWMPLASLLVHSAALVHHGGGGTTLTALAMGVPQLMLPDGADRHLNAQAVGDRGAGLVAAATEIDADLLRRLIEDDALRSAAGEVRAELAGMPSPADLVPRLAELAAR